MEDVSRQNTTISICINEGMENIPISDVSEILKHFQNIVYHIDAHLQNLKVNTQFQRNVIRESTLYWKDSSKGSLVVDMFFESYQDNLSTYVEKSPVNSLPRLPQIPHVIQEIIQKTNGDPQPVDAYTNLIDDQERLWHIMSEIDKIWPDSDESKLSVNFGSQKISLDPEHKENINMILTEISSEKDSDKKKTYIGRVVDTSVNPRKILLNTPNGKVSLKYSQGMENKMKDALMKFVSIQVFSNELKDESDISDCNVYLLEGLSEKCSLSLKEPLKLDLSYDDEDEVYLVYVEAFNLCTYSGSLKTAVAEISIHVEDLWDEYVLDNDVTLSKSGLRLRESLQKYLEEKQ